MNGFGIFYWANDKSNEGKQKDIKVKRRGKNNKLLPDCDRYEGQWKDGNRTGYGKFYWADGKIYEGEWKDNKRSGRGK